MKEYKSKLVANTEPIKGDTGDNPITLIEDKLLDRLLLVSPTRRYNSKRTETDDVQMDGRNNSEDA